jgi:sugar lactone lactonase YvrE
LYVYPPGSTTPGRTITESIVPQADQIGFIPNYVAVGPDGTIYLTEFTFGYPDPLAGLYIYPPSGPERFVANGAEYPQGVDLDAAGNIYVVNNSTNFNDGDASPIAEQNLTVLSPDGGTVLRRIGGLVNPIPVAVAADGTAFVSDYSYPNDASTAATFVVAPGASNVSEIVPDQVANIILWNGGTEYTGIARRSGESVSRGSAHAGGLGVRRQFGTAGR